MRTPKNIKLIKATYIKDYVYKFEFSNDITQYTDFRLIVSQGGLYTKFLDIVRFKKMHYNEDGFIYWGKNWDICFRLDQYYRVSKIIPVPKRVYKNYLKKAGFT